MELFEQPSPLLPLLFIIYGATGVVPLLAALYLLLRRANAIAPDVKPPVRLRRWAASFFIMAALGHVWWYLFYVYSHGFHSVYDVVHSSGYVVAVVLDCMTLHTTLAGTLLSMLQDRRRRIWPVFVAMLPFVAMGGGNFVPSQSFRQAHCYCIRAVALRVLHRLHGVCRQTLRTVAE